MAIRRNVRGSRRVSRFGRRVNESYQVANVMFALQSKEDPSLFVTAGDAVTEAVDDETGLKFTDSMDENEIVIFDNFADAQAFIDNNEAGDIAQVVAIEIMGDGEEPEMEEEEGFVDGEEIAEGYRNYRRARARALRESARTRRPSRMTESRSLRESRRPARPARPSMRSRLGESTRVRPSMRSRQLRRR